MATEDRWYVSGSLGVGTAFDELTDAPGPLSVAFANVGSAIRRTGGETLNLLESGAAAVNRGPGLNLWALNAGSPPKAVRLASIASGFGSTGDGSASGYLAFSTKGPTGDIAEALRLTPQQAVRTPLTLSVGPVTAGVASGRIEVSGASAELAFLRRSLSAWPAAPAAGDRYVWYNPDGSARLWTEAVGDVLTVQSSGAVGIGTTAPKARLHVVGVGLISDGDGSAVPNGHMARGSLTIGSLTSSFGGGTSWNANTAGLLLETLANTEIAVHDSYTRVASMMYYEGEGTNRLTIGRDMGWGAISTVAINGNLGAGTLAPAARLHVNGDAIVGGALTASSVRVQGVFTVQGSVNDATARSVLDSMPPYTVIMAVEPTTQGTAICWYWKDGNGARHKGWNGGVGL